MTCATSSDVMLGRISRVMMREVGLARHDGGGHEVALAQRQRLRAQHARVPRPARDDQHQRERERARTAGRRRCTMASGRPGMHQEDVEEQRQQRRPRGRRSSRRSRPRARRPARRRGPPRSRSPARRACPPPAARARPAPGRWCRARCAAEGGCSGMPTSAGRVARRATGRRGRRSTKKREDAPRRPRPCGRAGWPRPGAPAGWRRSPGAHAARPGCADRARGRRGPPASSRPAPPG